MTAAFQRWGNFFQKFFWLICTISGIFFVIWVCANLICPCSLVVYVNVGQIGFVLSSSSLIPTIINAVFILFAIPSAVSVSKFLMSAKRIHHFSSCRSVPDQKLFCICVDPSTNTVLKLFLHASETPP